jgi:hypothetical protein
MYIHRIYIKIKKGIKDPLLDEDPNLMMRFNQRFKEDATARNITIWLDAFAENFGDKMPDKGEFRLPFKYKSSVYNEYVADIRSANLEKRSQQQQHREGAPPVTPANIIRSHNDDGGRRRVGWYTLYIVHHHYYSLNNIYLW